MTNGTAQKSPSLNMISEGTRIKGTISSENDIRIAGRVDGEALCKGKLIVTSTARVDGNVIATDADIAGTIDGTLKITKKLTLRQAAKVGGDIYTKVLVVEEGAQLNGSCRMGTLDGSLDELTDAEFAEETRKNES